MDQNMQKHSSWEIVTSLYPHKGNSRSIIRDESGSNKSEQMISKSDQLQQFWTVGGPQEKKKRAPQKGKYVK